MTMAQTPTAAINATAQSFMSKPKYFFYKLSSNPWPKQDSSDHRIKQILDLCHALRSRLKRFLDTLVAMCADLLVGTQSCLCCVNLFAHRSPQNITCCVCANLRSGCCTCVFRPELQRDRRGHIGGCVLKCQVNHGDLISSNRGCAKNPSSKR